MKRSHIATMTAAGAAVLLSLGVYAAKAAESHQNDAVPVAQAAVSLTQAITAAEQHAGGKASKAEYEQGGKGGAWVYDVEVVAGATVLDVQVDPRTGAVLSSKEDKSDGDDNEHDEKD